MNKKSQLLFAERCSVLMESGISLSETLSIVIRMQKSKKINRIISSIQESLNKGMSFSKSISYSKVMLDPTLFSMITYGESAGMLALSMRQASDILAKRSDIQKKMVGALIYPMFIALATVGMTLFLVMYIFPKIIPLFSSMNITLPLLTRVVRKIYEVIAEYGIWLAISGTVVTGIIIYLYKKKEIIKYKIQITLLTLPFVGEVLKKYLLSTYLRSLGTLLETGQSLPVIIHKGLMTTSWLPYKKAWSFIHLEVLRGMSLSTSMREFNSLFPSIVPDMLSIGERTGTLATMLERISRMYEDELDISIKYLSATLEPVLMICMGLVVGGVALSIILPIYEITNHLSS